MERKKGRPRLLVVAAIFIDKLQVMNKHGKIYN